jgi:Mce-associated membrane protein
LAKHDASPEDELMKSSAIVEDIVEDIEAEDTEADDVDAENTVAGDADDAAEADYDAEAEHQAAPGTRWLSPVRTATLVSVAIFVVAAALVGFLSFRTYQSEQAKNRDELFVAAARQGAVNLTTIDWQEADADINRILDSATGTFYDDFSKRSQPFVEVVKQAQSKSVGTVTEAGLESASGDRAQVLVAVQVKTTNLGAQEQRPRAWRMRIDVQKLGDQAKVSNVQFVP